MNSPRFLFTTAAAVAATLAVKESAAPAPQTAATSSSQSKPLRVYGLSSDNALIRFNANLPKRERFIGYITGSIPTPRSSASISGSRTGCFMQSATRAASIPLIRRTHRRLSLTASTSH